MEQPDSHTQSVTADHGLSTGEESAGTTRHSDKEGLAFSSGSSSGVSSQFLLLLLGVPPPVVLLVLR